MVRGAQAAAVDKVGRSSFQTIQRDVNALGERLGQQKGA